MEKLPEVTQNSRIVLCWWLLLAFSTDLSTSVLALISWFGVLGASYFLCLTLVLRLLIAWLWLLTLQRLVSSGVYIVRSISWVSSFREGGVWLVRLRRSWWLLLLCQRWFSILVVWWGTILFRWRTILGRCWRSCGCRWRSIWRRSVILSWSWILSLVLWAHRWLSWRRWSRVLPLSLRAYGCLPRWIVLWSSWSCRNFPVVLWPTASFILSFRSAVVFSIFGPFSVGCSWSRLKCRLWLFWCRLTTW